METQGSGVFSSNSTKMPINANYAFGCSFGYILHVEFHITLGWQRKVQTIPYANWRACFILPDGLR